MRQKWTSEEAAALKAGIDKHGAGKWTKILKDQKFGPILHLRTNVDLKDKWRNFALVANGFGSRHGVRGDQRNTRKKMKRRGMSLSTFVLSDPKIVVTKPLTVLSGTSEVSELDSINESISRLDNATVDAITYAKEPCGSSQTAVSTYLEMKEEVSGVSGEYSDLPQELFEKGKQIEVLTCEEGFSSSWYVATVIESPPTLSHLNKYYVKYETLMDDYDLSRPLKELVDAKLIRPICPLTSVGSFRVGDIVDALYYDGWWIGTVTKALSNSKFKVKFSAPLAEHKFHLSELRLHLDWVNGQWINPRTQTKEKEISELDSDTPEILKRRGRPAKNHKSLTTGNESIVGVRVAEGIKGNHCEANGFALDDTRSHQDTSPCQTYPVINGNISHPDVITAEETGKNECEMEDIAQMPDLLTCNWTESPQDNTPSRSPPDESQTFIRGQKGEKIVSPRLIIETKEKEISGLDSDTPKIVKKRGRPPKIHGNESIAGVRTAEGIKEKHCEAKGFAPISVGLARHKTRSRRGSVSHPGIRIAEGTEEKDCEMENNSPKLILLTSNGTKSPQDNTPCQSPSYESQAFISDHKGEGNVSPRLTIKERITNSLSQQRGMSTEQLKPSRMEMPTESWEMAECVVSSDNLERHYLHKRGKTSADPFTESPHVTADDVSSKETEVCTVAANSTPGSGLDVNQILPFKKTVPLWDIIESMEVFHLFPQRPHFRCLEYNNEDCREGLALGQMVTFSKIVKRIAEMRGGMPRSSMEKCLENLIILEENGFDVRTIRDRLKDVEQEIRITEFKEKKRKINADVDEIEKKLNELQAKREAAMLKMELRDAAIEASRLLLNNIKDRMKSMQFDFKEVAAASW